MSNSERKRCLWVDDDHAEYYGFEGFLSDAFPDMELAGSYKRARELVNGFAPPPCCILDAILPYDGSTPSFRTYVGIELARKLCEHERPPLLIVFLTVQAEDRLGIDGLRKSFVATQFWYIPKIEIASSSRTVVQRILSMLEDAEKRQPTEVRT